MLRLRASTLLLYGLVSLTLNAPLLGAVEPPQPPAANEKKDAQIALSSNSALGVFTGRIVTSIHFDGPELLSPSQLQELVVQRVGEPLDKAKIRRSMDALFATGRFADLRVEATSGPDNGVAILFVTRENYFVGFVDVSGAPSPPSASQLVHATKLELGELFLQQKVDRGMAAIKRILEENGYYKPTLTVSYDRNPKNQQVEIHFNLLAGPQARIGSLKITGSPGLSQRDFEAAAKMRPGGRVTAAHTSRALQRLRKKYNKQSRITAQISITDRTYRAAPNTVDYVFKINEGPKVDIKVEGFRLGKAYIRVLVPVYEENAIDDDLVSEGATNIRNYLQTKGYFEAGISFTHKVDAAGGRETVIYNVNHGELSKVTDLVIEGNKYFTAEIIRERMQVQPADILNRHGLYSESLLRRDAKSIESLYIANGFQQVKVTPKVEDDYKGVIGRMRITLQIEEGVQTRVASLQIVGNEAIASDSIRELVSSTEGQPYSNFNIAGDRDAVLNMYFNRGFPNAKMEALADPLASDKSRMKVVYTISEGQQIFVNQILVTGLHHTQPRVVNREIQVTAGGPLSENDILDTQRRLYNLGIFNEVNVGVQNPTGEDRSKNILVQVDEAKRYTFSYGIGLEIQTGDVTGSNKVRCIRIPGCVLRPQGNTGFSPRVSFDVTRINFRGRNHTIVFKSRLGRLQRRALVSYEQPRWLNHPNFTLTFTGFFDKTRDVRTFTVSRMEGSVQARQILNKATTLLYRFTYRRVKIDPNTLVVDPAQIPLLSKPVRVGLPSLTYIRDTRDNPTDSHKGTYNTMDLGVASGIFGSESSFSRLLLQNSSYYTFGKKKWVIARSVSFGFEEPFGKSGTFIPLPERFFSGGSNSHRGFSLSQAGPRDLDTGFPVGGEALLLHNIELRSPPIALPIVGDNLSAVIFHDAGNVFTSSGDALSNLFHFSQKSRNDCRSLAPTSKCDLNYVQHAIGAGLRYRTPIGPVRIDLGYNLNPPTFPVRREARFETLRHFNIFFSIGQTF